MIGGALLLVVDHVGNRREWERFLVSVTMIMWDHGALQLEFLDRTLHSGSSGRQ
jgi:hypothetical protein